MNYDVFFDCPVGTVKTLIVTDGLLRFVKMSGTMWLVEFSMTNVEPFGYTRFTTSITSMEASVLFDKYSNVK